ncbi:MAG: OsmC family protein [bacterium]|nr:OsmC family protein [bacterium]MXX64585.1 OsmC family protein [Acidimicrobiia bacterium]MCY3580548.1 OsmC family protein [bacterium]MCY3651806.1 OsmC family protein [bacterium]MDE0642747.1 OsmC family protein [bacterium]
MSTGQINGVNTTHLLGARAAVGDAPEAGKFTWKAQNEWVHGTHSKSTVKGYFGLGEDHDHTDTFKFDSDHPLVFAAEDNAATPVEIVLVGLASCLTAGVAAVAENREIKLRSVKASVEADMDIAGILGADPEVRNGFSDVRVNYQIEADDASEADLEALVAQSQKVSAVFDIMTNPTNVTVNVS